MIQCLATVMYSKIDAVNVCSGAQFCNEVAGNEIYNDNQSEVVVNCFFIDGVNS